MPRKNFGEAKTRPTQPCRKPKLEVSKHYVGIVISYVCWAGHDAAGTLPPLDVVAGILRPDALRLPAWWSPPGPDEITVYVPAQWIGDWETGHTLAPAYQYLWRAPRSQLHSPVGLPQNRSYRPDRLPDSAIGPRLRQTSR